MYEKSLDSTTQIRFVQPLLFIDWSFDNGKWKIFSIWNEHHIYHCKWRKKISVDFFYAKAIGIFLAKLISDDGYNKMAKD